LLIYAHKITAEMGYLVGYVAHMPLDRAKSNREFFIGGAGN
jgi:hypothetical protein